MSERGMGDSWVDAPKEVFKAVSSPIVRYKKTAVASGVTLLSFITVLNTLDMNIFDFAVTNSPKYQIHEKAMQDHIDTLLMQNQILLDEIKHLKHIKETQNKIVDKLEDHEWLTKTERREMIHPLRHDD